MKALSHRRQPFSPVHEAGAEKVGCQAGTGGPEVGRLRLEGQGMRKLTAGEGSKR